jgi:hypothetical protein
MSFKFIVGITYATRSAVDADQVTAFEILRRTDKSVWIKHRGEEVRRSIRVGADDVERFDPYGRYSLSLVISADRTESTVERQAATVPAFVPAHAPTLRFYQQQVENHMVANRFNHATMFISRFCGSPTKREDVRFVLDMLSRMNKADFDDLDLIREYLRGE